MVRQKRNEELHTFTHSKEKLEKSGHSAFSPTLEGEKMFKSRRDRSNCQEGFTGSSASLHIEEIDDDEMQFGNIRENRVTQGGFYGNIEEPEDDDELLDSFLNPNSGKMPPTTKGANPLRNSHS